MGGAQSWPVWLIPALAACSAGHEIARPAWSTSELAAQQRCETGQIDACGELGRSLVGEQRELRDVQRGLVLLEGACGRDELRACAALGGWYSGHDEDEHHARATELLTRACDGGVAEGCRGLARLIGSKSVSAASAEEFAHMSRLFQKACDLGDARGCMDAGSMAGLMRGDRAFEDQERLYARACALHLPEGCQLLAMHHLRDPNTTDQAITELVRNCAAGTDQGCLQAAEAHAPVIGQRPSCAQAVPLAARACLARMDDGCVVQDACASRANRDAALARLRAACDRHSSMACFYWAEAQPAAESAAESTYAELCKGRRSRVTDPACARLALLHLQRATNSAESEGPLTELRRLCDHFVTAACCTLVDVYTNGRFVVPDPDSAAGARAHACPSCCDGP